MITNTRISGQQTFPYSESDIRVDFNNTDRVIAAANTNVTAGGTGQGQFYSADGGQTWNQTSLSLNTGDNFQSDPCVDWTSDGTAWAITIGFDSLQTHLRLHAFKSGDGGQTWTYDADASGTQTNADKEMMWADHSPTSPYRDNIYLIWHDGAPVFVNRRTGPGGSWQTPLQVSGAETTGTGIGGDIKTNSKGDVFAFWPDTGSQHIFVAKSTNGGGSFSAPVTIATTVGSFTIAIPADDSRPPLIYVTGGTYRTATKDLVYAAWMDLSGEPGCTTAGSAPGSATASSCKTRIWFSRSTNGGANWSAPVMVNNQASKNDQFHPKLAIDETNGQLVLVYYDTVGDPGRLKTDIWMQTSEDDGQTWSAAFRVTTAETDETSAGADLPTNPFGFGDQYGDYIGLTGYASSFHPCWTDRRNGAREEIWSAAVRTIKTAELVIERSTFGQDEVLALLAQANPGVIPEAFWVVVDGFTAQELGLNTGNLNNPPILPAITLTPAMTAMTTQFVGPVVPEDPSLPPSPQRFRYGFSVSFTSDADFSFAGDSEMVTLSATLTAASTTVNASGLLELIKKANPYVLNGPTSWLSIDMRVFKLRAGDSRFGQVMGAGAAQAPAYIQAVVNALNAGGGSAGGDSFEGLTTDEQASALELAPVDSGGNAVFDFALARVRMRGLTQDAQNTRVFFRLFQAQSTNARYDRPATNTAGSDPVGLSYRRYWDGTQGGQAIPLLGVKAGEYVTIPCFAQARVDTTTLSMSSQTDPTDVQTIAHDPTGNEVHAYYGCWLDINQPSQLVVPQTPPAGNPDGPYSGSLLSIQQAIVRSPHQCIVAEVAFDPDQIPLGVDPSTTDKLAQRNLAWVSIPNPGTDGSRRAPQTFEVGPSQNLVGGSDQYPDELMIDWRGLPAGSTAQVYLPAVNADDILSLTRRHYTTRRLRRIDAHTIECPADAVTYIPIPSGYNSDFAGLLTVDFPLSVHKGELYRAIVRQITNAQGLVPQPPQPPPPAPPIAAQVAVGRTPLAWRRVFGAFQLNIPVHTKAELLPNAERELSILRWIAEGIASNSRWHPVFDRYLQQLAGRVHGFGGDPTTIQPSPTGEWRHRPLPEPSDVDRGETGKVIGLIYDRFGDFEGFYLETEYGHEHRYYSREHEIEDLVAKAWATRAVITVYTDSHHAHRVATLVIRRAPRPEQH